MACERRQKPGPHSATQPAAQPASQPGQARQVETGQGGRGTQGVSLQLTFLISPHMAGRDSEYLVFC